MIDFNNPLRPDIEKITLPNQDAVDTMFNNMDDVLSNINNGALSLELFNINKAYLDQCLSYETIQQDGRDLSIYIL